MILTIVCSNRSRHRPRRLGRHRLDRADRVGVWTRAVWVAYGVTNAFAWTCPTCRRHVRRKGSWLRQQIEAEPGTIDISHIE